MACKCKVLKSKEDINIGLLNGEARITLNWKIKTIVTIGFIFMLPILIVKSLIKKWRKVTE
jgi:hypothetical protein